MVLELLHGKQEPQTAYQLSQQLGITQRQVTAAVHEERLRGAAICSCSFGYYKAVTPDEIEMTCRQLKSRANETIKVMLALEDTARNL